MIELSRTPTVAWNEMLDGNRRFVQGEPSHPRQDVDHREQLLGTQSPHAALFGCSDSRLAAEIIFDQGLGDLFVVRNAGQVVSGSVLGSLEYAVAVLGVPLIVVLGHDACGAVASAIAALQPDAAALPRHIQGVIEKILPAVHRVAKKNRSDEPTTVSNTHQLDAAEVGREHLRDTVAELLHSSELISDAIAAGTLAIVGANYRLREGTVNVDAVVGIV